MDVAGRDPAHLDAPLDAGALIRVRGLVVGFGDQTVLDGLSFDVRRGEILGVVGASGSGKTVLLRTLIGLVPTRSGVIEIAEAAGAPGIAGGPPATPEGRASRPRSQDALTRQWGVLFQQGALFSSLTVRQNVQFPLRENLRLSEILLDELADVKLEMVGLNRRDGDKFPSEISGGMTKRAALARALALDPDLVFLDEPTSGLDPIAAGEFDTLIRTLQQTLGLTVFMVTHDLDSLNTVCDRIAVLAGGRIVAEGPMAAMLSSEHPWVKSYFRGKRSRAASAPTETAE
jgi:phospholipid/cholesterol/gamma-HCH transport system ATP-binding protein